MQQLSTLMFKVKNNVPSLFVKASLAEMKFMITTQGNQSIVTKTIKKLHEKIIYLHKSGLLE